MKKITFLLLLVLPFLGFTQELAPNPTLNGSTSWSNLSPGTTQKYDGTFTRTADGSGSWLINSNGTYNSGIVSSAISGIVAGDYVLSYYVYGNAGDKAKPIIRDNGTSTNVQGAVYTIQADNTWELVEQTFTLSGAGTVTLRAMVNSVDTAMDFYVDDFSFTYIPPAGNTLTINVVGSGTVTKNPDKISYDPTDVVLLTATPSSHWSFDSWSGDLTGSTNPGNITMDTDKTVNANFVIDPAFDYAFTFDNDSDMEGWTMGDPQISIMSHTGGLVTLAVVADQWSRFDLKGFPIPSGTYNKVTITLQNLTTNDQLGFIVDDGAPELVTQTISTNDSGFQAYDFDLTQFLKWTGDVNYVRIRFAEGANTKPLVSGNIVIDDVVFSYDSSLSSKDFEVSPFSIYPNPAKNLLNISSKTEVSKVQVYDITGKQVLETAKLNSNQLNVSSLKAGLYILHIEDVNKNAIIEKLVIK